MNYEEEAIELVETFAETIKPLVLVERDWTVAKQCALICVDKILDALYDNIKIKSKCHEDYEKVKEAIYKL